MGLGLQPLGNHALVPAVPSRQGRLVLHLRANRLVVLLLGQVVVLVLQSLHAWLEVTALLVVSDGPLNRVLVLDPHHLFALCLLHEVIELRARLLGRGHVTAQDLLGLLGFRLLVLAQHLNKAFRLVVLITLLLQGQRSGGLLILGAVEAFHGRLRVSLLVGVVTVLVAVEVLVPVVRLRRNVGQVGFRSDSLSSDLLHTLRQRHSVQVVS